MGKGKHKKDKDKKGKKKNKDKKNKKNNNNKKNQNNKIKHSQEGCGCSCEPHSDPERGAQLSVLMDEMSQIKELVAGVAADFAQLKKQMQAPRQQPLQGLPIQGPRSSPKHPKFFLHARYRRHELTFHQQVWAELGMSPTSESDWTVRWNMRMHPSLWAGFKPWQKTNFIPGILELVRKDKLHRLFQKMAKVHGSQPFSFWPLSFHLPADMNAFVAHYERLPPGTPWILKPPSASCGRRIRMMTSLSDMPDEEWLTKNHPVAQQYLDTVLLDGYKFTFRIYCVVTSVDPLRVYIYRDGLTRIASKKYSKTDFSDLFIHLDSVDVNEDNEAEFRKNPPRGVETEGLRSTVRKTLEFLAQRDGINADAVWDDIRDVVVKTILAGERPMTEQVRRFVKYRDSAFDLLGFDVLLDSSYKCWVIEVNHSPSMAPITAMENEIKKDMVRGYFSLANLSLADRVPLLDTVASVTKYLNSVRAPGETLYTLKDFAELHKTQDLRLTRLSQRDVHAIVSSKLENERRCNFERVFPCKDMREKYGDIYVKNRNILMQIWHDKKLQDSFDHVKVEKVKAAKVAKQPK